MIHNTVRSKMIPYIYFSPVLILFSVFFIYPFFYSIFISFNDWKILTGQTTYVGLNNYRQLFGDAVFWKSLGNTLYYVVVLMSISVFLGLMYALLIENTKKSKAIYRLIFFIPVIISIPAVSISLSAHAAVLDRFLIIFPSRFGLQGFREVFDLTPYGRWFINSIYVSAILTIVQLAVGVFAAFALSRYKFKGREVLFFFVLCTMMIPPPGGDAARFHGN